MSGRCAAAGLELCSNCLEHCLPVCGEVDEEGYILCELPCRRVWLCVYHVYKLVGGLSASPTRVYWDRYARDFVIEVGKLDRVVLYLEVEMSGEIWLG